MYCSRKPEGTGYGGFVVEKVALGQAFLTIFRVFSVRIIPPASLTHIYFNTDPVRVILANDRVGK
jgi:hypothetical protein